MLQLNEAVDIAMAMKGYNKKTLATEIGMSPSAFTDFLNGKTTKLDITKAQSIADALGCTINYLVGDDTLKIDLSAALKAEREEHGETSDVVALNTRIPEALILKYESGDEEVSEFLLKKLCQHYDLEVPEFLQKYDLWDDYVPAAFNGDANAFTAFKKAEREDALKSSAGYPELRDIVEKGMYVVNGQPARRSYKHNLDFASIQIYMNPDGVWSPNDVKGDVEAATKEYIEVTRRIGSPELVEFMDAVLARPENQSRDKQLNVAMDFYYEAFNGRDFTSKYHNQ